MKKFAKLFLIILMLLFVTSAFADWRADFTWTPNTDPACTGYEIVMDGAVVVPGIPTVDGTASYTVTDIIGQSFVLRTLGLGGEFVDSDPIIAAKAPPGSVGFAVQFVHVP